MRLLAGCFPEQGKRFFGKIAQQEFALLKVLPGDVQGRFGRAFHEAVPQGVEVFAVVWRQVQGLLQEGMEAGDGGDGGGYGDVHSYGGGKLRVIG